MSLFSNRNVNVFNVVTKTSKNGAEYVKCNLVFYSKSKDVNGNFRDDPKFSITGISYSKKVIEYLKSLPSGKGFINVIGNLEDVIYEKDGHKRKVCQFNISKVTEPIYKNSEVSCECAASLNDEIEESEEIPF